MTALPSAVFARRLRESKKIPLTFEFIAARKPKYSLPLVDPFISSSSILKYLPKTRFKIFRCKLEASSN